MRSVKAQQSSRCPSTFSFRLLRFACGLRRVSDTFQLLTT
jgi:hypothetical protein